jgi:hypothetical protein
MSLSSADLHFIGLVKGLAGYVVPSRVYGVMVTGRPALVAADAESETAQIVEGVGCGIVLPPGRPELVAGAIRDAHGGRYDLDAMGRRGRDYAVAEAGRGVAVARYRVVLGELLDGRVTVPAAAREKA